MWFINLDMSEFGRKQDDSVIRTGCHAEWGEKPQLPGNCEQDESRWIATGMTREGAVSRMNASQETGLPE